MRQKLRVLLAAATAVSMLLCACGAGAAGTSAGADAPQAVTEPAEAPDTAAPEEVQTEAPGSGPADVSDISSVDGVPLVTLSNGVEVPQLGLGTQIQSLEGDSSQEGRDLLNETARQATEAALEDGYRHLDDADGYYNQKGVGQGIIDSGVPREEIWVTSKVWPSEYDDAMEAIDGMLDRMQLDYLDCVYLHHPAGDYMTAWRGLEEAYREGKVRSIGISNFDNEMDAFNEILENAEIKPQIMQIECHPFAQRTDTIALAEQYDMAVECWYPIGHADPELLQNETLQEIADAHDRSVVQVILRWHMQEGHIAIPGSTNPDHISENLDIFDFALSEDEMEEIRRLDQGDAGRYFNIDYSGMTGRYFTAPIDLDY